MHRHEHATSAQDAQTKRPENVAIQFCVANVIYKFSGKFHFWSLLKMCERKWSPHALRSFQLLVSDLKDWLQRRITECQVSIKYNHKKTSPLHRGKSNWDPIDSVSNILDFETDKSNSHIHGGSEYLDWFICFFFFINAWMVDILVSHWVNHTQQHTHTPLLQSWLRALDSRVQSGAEACYLQTRGGQV